MDENNEILSQESIGAITVEESQSPKPDSLKKEDAQDSSVPHEMVQGMQSLLQDMHILKQDFDTKVKYDESKERLIDSLHRELQGYREGLHFRILRPVFVDLMTLHDDFDKLIENIPSDADGTPHRVTQNLKMFLETIEEILSRNGAEAFTTDEDIFSPSKQRNLRVIPTSDPEQDKHIARRVRKGFVYEGKLLRPEVVEIYKYVPSTLS